MTFSAVTSRGSSVSNSSTSTITHSPTADITPGKICIVQFVADNLATTDGPSSNHSVSDTDGHTWTKVYEDTETDGALGDGVTVSLWWTLVQSTISTTDVITGTLTAARSDKTLGVFEVTIGSGNTVETIVSSITRSATGSSADVSASLSGLTSRQYLYVGSYGSEGEDTLKAPVSGYTELFDLVSSTALAADVNVMAHVGYKIETSTGTTWTTIGATYTNASQAVVAFYEVALPPDALTAKDITTAAPTIDKATLAEINVLTAKDITTAAPTLDKAVIGQIHALTAKDITTAAPTIDKATAGVISTADDLVAKDITAGIPTVDKATIGQVHALVSRDITAGPPTLDKSTIGQTHALTAKDISTIPTIDKATIGQIHVLVAIDIFASPPTIDKATLTEQVSGGIDVLIAKDLVSGIPTIDKAVVGQIHNLIAKDLASGIPTIDQATIGQIHVLTSSDLFSGVPTLDKATLIQVVALISRDITAGIPTLDKATIGQVHNLVAQDISTIPTIEKSIIGQIHALLSQDLYAGVPTIDLARLFVNIYIAFGDLPLRDFDLSFEHEREKHFILKPRDSFHIELKRREDTIELESRRKDFTWTND